MSDIRAIVNKDDIGFGTVSGCTIAQGMPVMFESGYLVTCVSGTSACSGIAVDVEDGTFPAQIGDKVNYAKLGSQQTVKALVGTAGATAHKPAKASADGVTDATIGATVDALWCLGEFQQTGVVGDLVGLWLGCASPTVGS